MDGAAARAPGATSDGSPRRGAVPALHSRHPQLESDIKTVRDLLALKGATVVSVSPSSTVLDAAHIMGDNGFGAVLVMDGTRLVGIFTERDMLRRVVASERDPATSRVEEVMTTALFTCVPETTADECGAIMTRHRIRHLPVVDTTGLHGLVSIGDLLAHRVREQEDTIKFLNNYMFSVR